ncbi:hypothetical protein KGF56_003020 [Candida oxycetoniae]|uniref:Ribosomal protein L1 n=1 Tax=Candida oxycetoniae TaxID=497107 RepID=A0AAI9SWN2_9ASCO|nr:uncharacterized protein KGF56_003020 [Candida oxycetoniae]KAI3404120.2 hypothetical protein KGF56_003020 [Candida oxycetoniae]
MLRSVSSPLRQPMVLLRISTRFVSYDKESKTLLHQERGREKKRRLRKELKFNALENPAEHPLHMDIATALNTIRSFELGKPLKKTNITCSLYARQEQGAAPINANLNLPFPVNKKNNPLLFTTHQGVMEELESLIPRENMGGKELLDRFINQELLPGDFTHAFATCEMEPHLKSVSRILGPAKLQPTKKKGTVTDDLSVIRNILSSYQIKQRDFHISFTAGDCSFSDFQIISNLKAISDAIYRQIDPKASKKTRLGHCFITSANSPGLVIDFKNE